MLKTYPLFVYGTLKKGFPLHRALEDSTFVSPASLKGFNMYSLGAFPCVERDEKAGTITGEIYLVPPEVLIRLDFIEGAYNRQWHVTTDGRWVGVYVWAGNIPPGVKPIEGGVWGGGVGKEEKEKEEKEKK